MAQKTLPTYDLYICQKFCSSPKRGKIQRLRNFMRKKLLLLNLFTQSIQKTENMKHVKSTVKVIFCIKFMRCKESKLSWIFGREKIQPKFKVQLDHIGPLHITISRSGLTRKYPSILCPTSPELLYMHQLYSPLVC